jgi:DNA-3-methyladenine glycosylase I
MAKSDEMDGRLRCRWAESEALMREYHDEEWGVPQYDSRMLWEMLMLEGFQAGLSWAIILRKREGFRRAFKGFDPAKVARFKDVDIERLMGDAGIVRARAKIEATIAGATIYLEMQRSGGIFPTMCGGWRVASRCRGRVWCWRRQRYRRRYPRL